MLVVVSADGGAGVSIPLSIDVYTEAALGILEPSDNDARPTGFRLMVLDDPNGKVVLARGLSGSFGGLPGAPTPDALPTRSSLPDEKALNREDWTDRSVGEVG
jgi:hypothetical protein